MYVIGLRWFPCHLESRNIFETWLASWLFTATSKVEFLSSRQINVIRKEIISQTEVFMNLHVNPAKKKEIQLLFHVNLLLISYSVTSPWF